MDVDDSLEYEELKSAILRKYDINRESYRQRFHTLDVEPLESPKELYVRLKELYEKWMQPKNLSFEEIGEVIILEQYLRMLSPEIQVWVREHDPQSASQASKHWRMCLWQHVRGISPGVGNPAGMIADQTSPSNPRGTFPVLVNLQEEGLPL